MANPIYTSRQADFIRHFVGSDSELTTAFNGAFGTDVSKAAMRKKRQRMGISKTAEQFRIAWTTLLGLSDDEIRANLINYPPKDILAEQKELAALRRMREQAMHPWT